MNKYHIAQSFQSLLYFYGENHQSYKDVPDIKSAVSTGILRFCSISESRTISFGEFEGENYKEALEKFVKEVDKWLPKIVFMTQTSIEGWQGTVCYKQEANCAIL